MKTENDLMNLKRGVKTGHLGRRKRFLTHLILWLLLLPAGVCHVFAGEAEDTSPVTSISIASGDIGSPEDEWQQADNASLTVSSSRLYIRGTDSTDIDLGYGGSAGGAPALSLSDAAGQVSVAAGDFATVTLKAKNLNQARYTVRAICTNIAYAPDSDTTGDMVEAVLIPTSLKTDSFSLQIKGLTAGSAMVTVEVVGKTDGLVKCDLTIPVTVYAACSLMRAPDQSKWPGGTAGSGESIQAVVTMRAGQSLRVPFGLQDSVGKQMDLAYQGAACSPSWYAASEKTAIVELEGEEAGTGFIKVTMTDPEADSQVVDSQLWQVNVLPSLSLTADTPAIAAQVNEEKRVVLSFDGTEETVHLFGRCLDVENMSSEDRPVLAFDESWDTGGKSIGVTLQAKKAGNYQFAVSLLNDDNDLLAITSILLTAADNETQTLPAVRKLSYSFVNSAASFGYNPNGYSIGIGLFKKIFANSQIAYAQKHEVGTWKGSCLGMSATAGLFYNSILQTETGGTPTGPKPSDYVSGAVYVGDLSAGSVKEKIEMMQIAQYSRDYARIRENNENKLSALIAAVKAAEAQPVEVAVSGPYGGKITGHSLLAYSYEDNSDGTGRIKVYDCNYPFAERYITVRDGTNGTSLFWSYNLGPLFGNTVWSSSNMPACRITYAGYADYYGIWQKCESGQLNADDGGNLLITNSESFSLYDFLGRECVVVEDGCVAAAAQGIDNETISVIRTDLAQGMDGAEGSILYVPYGAYTLQSHDTDGRELKAVMLDSGSGIEVTTGDNEIEFAVDSQTEGQNIQEVELGGVPGVTYEVAMLRHNGGAFWKSDTLLGEGIGQAVKVGMSLDKSGLGQLSMAIGSTSIGLGSTGWTNEETGETRTTTYQIDFPEETDPTEKPTEKPTENPTEKPTEDPTEKPAGDPSQQGPGSSTGGQTDDPAANYRGTKLVMNAYSVKLQKKQKSSALQASLVKGDAITSVSSSRPKIVKAVKKGTDRIKLTAKKTGKAKVTVKTKFGQSAVITVKVQKGKVRTTKLTLDTGTKITLSKGERITVKALVTPVTSQDKVKYSSSNRKVASASGKGVITAKKAGKAKITVKSGKKKKVITVTVK